MQGRFERFQTLRDAVALIEFSQSRASHNLKREIHRSYMAEFDNLARELATVSSDQVVSQAITTLGQIKEWLNSTREAISTQEANNWQASAFALKAWGEQEFYWV